MGRGNFCVKIARDLTRRNVFSLPPEEHSVASRIAQIFFSSPVSRNNVARDAFIAPVSICPAVPAGLHLYIHIYAYTRLDIYYISRIFFLSFFFSPTITINNAPGLNHRVSRYLSFRALSGDGICEYRAAYKDRVMRPLHAFHDHERLTVPYKVQTDRYLYRRVGAPSQLRICDIQPFSLNPEKSAR